MLVLLPVTLSNAPRMPGRLGLHAQLLFVSLSWIALIGESNRLAISDPDTDTLHLSPRDIINAMTALYGALTGVEVASTFKEKAFSTG
jgi:hypothetical protein